MQSRIPPDRTCTDADNIFHPEISVDPVGRIIEIIDQKGSALHIGITVTADKDRRGTALVIKAGLYCELGMEAAHDRAAGKTAQTFSLALGALHHNHLFRLNNNNKCSPVEPELSSADFFNWIVSLQTWPQAR